MYSIHSCFRLRRWFWLPATKTILRRALIMQRPQPERRECPERRAHLLRIRRCREHRGHPERRARPLRFRARRERQEHREHPHRNFAYDGVLAELIPPGRFLIET